MDEQIARADLGAVGSLLEAGTGATVHAVPELRLLDVSGPLAYKHYRDGHPPHGLRWAVRIRATLPPAARARLATIACWPVRVVRDHGKISGVLLPVIPASFFEAPRPGQETRQPRETRQLLGETTRAGTAERFAVCRDLAGALAFLHAHGVVFGDVNGENALYRIGETPSLMLIGCDGVRIRGSTAVVKRPGTMQWRAPEGEPPTPETDVYKLGLFILRALTPGPRAEAMRDPQRARNVLDAEGRRLLGASLAELGHRRPPAAEWEAYFSALARDGSRAGV